ncbi:uncharacterized protein B0H64DRAFT_201676 [Chaetomium fimeti]|uniref:C2H2-type domain-containing protein n=1 Tax=Chaetomium fimeti TaxID=1854472 RepID=A0AAE0HA78_9PEZI|nr:hypothetical protein B0H64DRAFT_201676 [Chaetomium fimeti]
MYVCDDCIKSFSAWWSREQHCTATGHRPPKYECDTCDAYFGSEQARWQHMNAKCHFSSSSDGGSSSWEKCRLCNDAFYTDKECNDHMVNEHLYCRDCDRTFMNHNNLRQHLNSSTHRGSTIPCPFCAATYTTATGMTHHLESGACPRAPSLNRNELYELVRARDPRGIISRHSVHPETVTYTATAAAYNGYGYECFFCQREFGTLHGLNQHLNSPAHQEVLYHCPNTRCGSEFKALAAVINHLESESCGAMRFETVQRQIGDIVSGNRLLQF